MTLKRRITFAFAVVCLVAIAGFCVMLYKVFAPFAARSRDADRAFVPLLDLNPAILDNAFGVYIVEFNAKSGLTDDNAARLLQLNELPSKYDLTLVIKTNKITDVAIPVLAELTSADLLIAEDSGITDSGIAELDTLLPRTRVPARERKAAKSGEQGVARGVGDVPVSTSEMVHRQPGER